MDQDSADCTILIPVPSLHRPGSADPPRRPKHDIQSAPRAAFRLHTHHLSAKSVFLRGLLSGISPVDLVQNLSPSDPLRIPRSRLPRLLPSPPSHPVVFLPVPDPSSIQLLFHWMYFGDTDLIEDALDKGLIQWEGLARNVEYLCLSIDIKVFLGRWYRNWFLPAHSSPDPIPCPPDDDDDDDSDLDSDGDASDCDGYSPCSSSSDDEMQCDEECDRGRTREIKPLMQLCAQFRLFTT